MGEGDRPLPVAYHTLTWSLQARSQEADVRGVLIFRRLLLEAQSLLMQLLARCPLLLAFPDDEVPSLAPEFLTVS